MLDPTEESNVHTSIFPGSATNDIYDLDIDHDEPAPAEIDDEQIRNALASPLCPQESEAEAGLRQTYHSNEESLFKRSQSVSVSTARPVFRQTQKQKSSQEVDD